METMFCPKGHGAMNEKTIDRAVTFRNVELNVKEDAFECPVCGFSAGTVASSGKLQQEIAEAYRKKTGLLTANDIKALRNEKALTQAQLAEFIGVGIASIKRWETGAIQSKSMDQALRNCLMPEPVVNEMTGNRKLSIPRIRLVAEAFKKELGRSIIKKGDKMLYAAKYIWYADMEAFKRLGRSMTGATYAHLPYGPQLNNYNELLNDIQQAEITSAEPLTEEELEIIREIARFFPHNRMVFDAAHEEPAWKQTENGELISYRFAKSLCAFTKSEEA